MPNIKKAWTFLGNHKYLVTLIIFLIIIGFVDKNNAIRRIKFAYEANELRNEIAKYKAGYNDSNEKLNELDNDSKAIEKIAREHYLMKAPYEEIYVIKDDKEEK